LLLYQVGAERQVNLAKRFELRGDELLEQVQLAVEALEAKGSPITPSAIGAALGKTVQHLKRYPKVKDFLSQVEVKYRLNRVEQSQTRENALLEQVMQAIEYLQSSGKQITQQAIGDIVGITPDGLKYYPKVKHVLKHIAEEAYSNRPRNFVLRENTLVEQVQEAVEMLKSSGELVTMLYENEQSPWAGRPRRLSSLTKI
jgi:hypothetical protein